jgi:hypothetical protein
MLLHNRSLSFLKPGYVFPDVFHPFLQIDKEQQGQSETVRGLFMHLVIGVRVVK